MKKLPFLLAALAAVLMPGTSVAQDVLLDRVIAIAEDDVITQTELDERIDVARKRLAERSSALPPDELLEKQVLERMVIERLQLQRAEKLGIRVDDITLNETTRDIARQNNMSLDELRENLLQDGIDFVAFREQLRGEIILERLRTRQIRNLVRISEQEVDDLISSQGSGPDSKMEYRLSHILIAMPEAPSPEESAEVRKKAEEMRKNIVEGGADFAEVAVGESDGQNALDGGDLGWRRTDRLPSIFMRAVKNMRKGEVSDVISSPSGLHIVKLADQRGGDVQMVNQTRPRHILISPNALQDDAQSRERLAEIKVSLDNGADFEELAKANSDDKGSASQGGDLGWANPGQFVPEFEEVMNSLEPGQLSEPFRSQFGWHIVQVLERREQDLTEDLKRAQARKYLQEQRSQQEFELWLRRLRDEAYVEYRLASS